MQDLRWLGLNVVSEVTAEGLSSVPGGNEGLSSMPGGNEGLPSMPGSDASVFRRG